MAEMTRAAIERRIRELSLQLSKILLLQQKERREPKLDLAILDSFLNEWRNLSQYYRDNIYNRTNDADADLQINLLVVSIYLEWMEDLRIFMNSASKSGKFDEADKLEETFDMLEYHMQHILEAASDLDDLKL